MEVMENYTTEPQWIVDQGESGSKYWRRETTGSNARVKFRCDVEVREFYRNDHELEEIEWPENQLATTTNNTLTMSMTIFCIAMTVILPWYIMGIN